LPSNVTVSDPELPRSAILAPTVEALALLDPGDASLAAPDPVAPDPAVSATRTLRAHAGSVHVSAVSIPGEPCHLKVSPCACERSVNEIVPWAVVAPDTVM
jgi:hypothetical protein